jgi:DNA ligase-1
MYMLQSISQNVTLVCCVINCKQDLVVPSLMNKGIEFSSSTLSMVPGIPIKPMLAKYIFLDALYASFFSLFQVMPDACECFGLLFVLFVPCGRITNGIPQALKLFQNKAFTCEYKYALFFFL